MSQSPAEALKRAALYTDEQAYTLVRLPAGAITAAAGVVAEIGTAFSALIADKDEVSLVIPSDALADFANRLPDHVASRQSYRLITFDIELDLDMVGFMARVSAVLAEADISILPLAAYSRDHILVKDDQLATALAALEQARSG